jgi:hypothetical protein
MIAIALMTFGCNPSATQSIPTPAPTIAPPAQAPAATVAIAPSFPTGAFTKLGWTWEFNPDGSDHIKSQWHEGTGAYTVTGNQVAFQDQVGSCKNYVGTYTWTYDGQVLMLTEVDDKCADRRNLIGYGKWVKQPLTLTFSGDTCVYSGPKSIPYGKFTVNLVDEGKGDTTYAFTIVTLKEGKTLADLQAGSSPDRPDCVKVDFLNANSHSVKSGSKQDEIDLTANFEFGDDPFYFVCFAGPPERKIGALGPVAVVK